MKVTRAGKHSFEGESQSHKDGKKLIHEPKLLEDTNGGLVILSSGLSLSKLISSLLLLHSTSQGTLLILSPSSATLKSKINFHLKTLNPQFYQVPVEITADLPVNHRHSLYSSGSVCFITPRILIVDLLTNKLPASIISGLIILNAHSVSKTSTEAFIVRIFRSLNRSAFVRVFSDRPQAMVSGFAKAERTMKCLHIRKLHLWPRFQVYVSHMVSSGSSLYDFDLFCPAFVPHILN
ncbi:DNA repair endonuclease uvh1 [Lathyrus oleraceus]|uniref:DNA repair endonuclease uvh1 n=1 Tax=Pisum sativum TaxID=3888 RepID=A0A9D5A949_PEA|nr:DNA repair endonuclease uvh1 [Pisum sativum]